MKSNLGRHQSDNPSSETEMLRMNKDLIIQQRKIMIDLNLVSPAHMEYLEIYAKKNYNIVLNMKAKL